MAEYLKCSFRKYPKSWYTGSSPLTSGTSKKIDTSRMHVHASKLSCTNIPINLGVLGFRKYLNCQFTFNNISISIRKNILAESNDLNFTTP
eukprot:10454545-Ditylum_brightwellii.AAC.1